MLVLGLAVTVAVVALARRHVAWVDAKERRERRRSERRATFQSDLRALQGDDEATED